jgi:phage terminase small subunit
MPRRADKSLVTRKVYKKKVQINPKQRAFVNEYLANGRNGAAAYRASYNSQGTPNTCEARARELLKNPRIAAVVASKDRILALAEQKQLEALEVTEERIINTIAALAFYDPREVLSWKAGKVMLTDSQDIPLRAIMPIREISALPNGGFRVRFHDRRAALMDLARLRGMITDSSRTFHFHEDLARMPPEEQHKRVAELLEFAASLKVPPTIDMEPSEEGEE